MIEIIIAPIKEFPVFIRDVISDEKDPVFYYPEITVNLKEQYKTIENIRKNNDRLTIYTYSAIILNCIETAIKINKKDIDKILIRFDRGNYKFYKNVNMGLIYDEFATLFDHCDDALLEYEKKETKK